MNNERIVRVSNTFLQIIGYQVHSYDRETRRFRLSLWSLSNFIIVTIIYLICFGHHFEESVFLKILENICPFLRKLIHIQLMMGLKVFLFDLYEMRQVIRGANGLADALPRIYAHRFSRNEAKAYVLLFSTLFISICIVFYIAFEMHFKLPPLDRILVALALFIPHFIVAGALRFYTIGLWLLREHLQNVSKDIDRYLILENEETKNRHGHNENSIVNIYEPDGVQLKALLDIHTQLDVLADKQHIFSKGLRRQLLLLLVMNTNCLLAGVYMRVYYESTWHILFDNRLKRIFDACNYGLFLLIFWDYICLCGTQAAFTRVKTNLYKKINATIKQRNKIAKSTRIVLKDIRDLLMGEFRFKIIGSIKLNFCVFLLMQILIALFVAIVVVYQYLKDHIKNIQDRLDDVESE